MLRQKEIEHKNSTIEYFKLLMAGEFKEGLRFFTADCKTHNPFVSGSIESLTDAMIAASKDMGAQSAEPEFAVKHVIAEGGLRQVHLFRFEGDKIAEYWDITQQVLPNMPNASGAF